MKILFVQLLILITLVSCGSDDDSSSNVSSPQAEETGLEVIVDRSDVIWGFEFMPDNRILFTERNGKFLISNLSGTVVTEAGTLPDVATGGEGGLLDVRLAPDFNTNNQIYYCYTGVSAGGKTQALGRATLSGDTLTNFERIFSAGDANLSSSHLGCRIEIQNSFLFLTVGDQTEDSQAQNPNSFLGKIVRMNLDGSNPEVWSLGHRNPQGLTTNPETKELVSSEHGPVGGDEINIITQNGNYGWPDTTGIEPIISWTPAIAPSGIAFYTGNQIPEWRGNLFVATLRGEHIRRLVLAGNQVVSEEILFGSFGSRFRNLRTGPDGLLYFSTDDGKIGRIIAQ